MPSKPLKNLLYAAALPMMGRRPQWKHAEGGSASGLRNAVERVWKRHRLVGGCVQILRAGEAAQLYTAGYANLRPQTPVQSDTVFRTASVAKAVCALLCMRLQTLGKLSVEEDISAFWHKKIRNPHFPDTEIPLGSLLSHTAGMVDSPQYFQSFAGDIPADALLSDSDSFLPQQPYAGFRYSNFAAGLIGSLLESRFQVSLEALMQQELFAPLGVQATFDITAADRGKVADGYRVLPPEKAPAFDAAQRRKAAKAITAPDPQHHFLLASGNLYIAAGEMAKLCQVMIHGQHEGKPFLNEKSLLDMRKPKAPHVLRAPGMRHGMGLLVLDSPDIWPAPLYGHQGFAYGAVNGFFFDQQGNGMISFNSGASELRAGRLGRLNRDMIRAVLTEMKQ